MFRVLNQLPASSSGVSPVAQQGYLVKEVDRNLKTVQEHYQRYTYTLNSDHLLCKLLAVLPISFTQSVQSYYDLLVDGTADYAHRAGLTTERYAGHIFDGEIYPGLREAIIGYGQSRLMSQDVIQDWRYWAPVRVVDHPYTDLRSYPLLPERASTGSGYATLYIDVPLLALQYRMWCLSNAYTEDGQIRVVGTMMSFLASFPLVNALWSHNDVVFRNAAFNGIHSKRILKAPVAISNQDILFAQVSAQTQDRLLGRQYSYSDMLHQVASFEGTQYEATRLPLLYDQRNTRWARDMGCYRIWDCLLNIAKASDSLVRNKQSNNDLYRALTRIKTEGTFTAAPITSDDKAYFLAWTDEMLDILA